MSKANTEAALAAPEKTELSVHNASGLSVSANDIDIPRINLVQKLSEIDAPVGSVVLDKKYVLASPDQQVGVVVLSALKGWREDIPYDADDIPRIVYSESQARELEAESEYGVLEFAEITLLFPQPEGVDDEVVYPFPLGDHNFAIGRINVAKDAYRQTYKRLATFAAFNPNTPIQNRIWNFQSSLISRGKYSWYAPSLSISPSNTDEAVRQFIATFNK